MAGDCAADAMEHLAGSEAVRAQNYSGHAKSYSPSTGQARLSKTRRLDAKW